jgi:hypothetical protein
MRLHPLVGGDHQQHRLDPGEAGQRVAQESLVAGDVHEAHLDLAFPQVGEAEIDGDAAGLLLGEPVAVDAGQGFDQLGLAVVDVAGSADDERHENVGRSATWTTPRARSG